MISCTEFILAYNELFKFLDRKHGRDAVVDFWIYISDNFLTNLDRRMIEKYGFRYEINYEDRDKGACTLKVTKDGKGKHKV